MSWRVEHTRTFLRELAQLPIDVGPWAVKIAFSQDSAARRAGTGQWVVTLLLPRKYKAPTEPW